MPILAILPKIQFERLLSRRAGLPSVQYHGPYSGVPLVRSTVDRMIGTSYNETVDRIKTAVRVNPTGSALRIGDVRFSGFRDANLYGLKTPTNTSGNSVVWRYFFCFGVSTVRKTYLTVAGNATILPTGSIVRSPLSTCTAKPAMARGGILTTLRVLLLNIPYRLSFPRFIRYDHLIILAEEAERCDKKLAGKTLAGVKRCGAKITARTRR